MHAWHLEPLANVLSRLGTNPQRGLTANEVRDRQSQFGANLLKEGTKRGALAILKAQFASPMVLILVGAALVSIGLREWLDVAAIGAIILLNAGLGFYQEYRAERAMAALRQLTVPEVRVRRDGEIRVIPATELVPGDIVLLEAGNLVPADGRLIHSSALRVQEAVLTGESEPVDKEAVDLSPGDYPLAERRNMVYKGTMVVYGRAEVVVTAIGMQTELGKVAHLLSHVESEPTPLQRKLAHLGRWLAVLALLLVIVVFVLGLVQGYHWQVMLLTALSLAVAIVPEGLPAIVTIALALSAQRMLKRRALVRQLLAVETLGSVTVICTDKTGTLTENRMTVQMIDLAGHRLTIESGFRGELLLDAPDLRHTHQSLAPGLALMLAGMALCSDANVRVSDKRLHALGEPTEVALAVAAAQFGFWKERLERAMPRAHEIPFDSERKRMTTVHPLTDACPFLCDWYEKARWIAFTKGAVEVLLPRCSHVWMPEGVKLLSDNERQQIIRAHNELAQQGMRVLGLAFRLMNDEEYAHAAAEGVLEEELTFVGLIGMMDPPRPEVPEAVRTCHEAGIRVVMITGDHPLTAQQIARTLGIAQNGRVLTWRELEQFDEEQLSSVLRESVLFARVSPEHKLRIVNAFKRNGEVVAMTGDGVNDAPALKRADIGVAMGQTGTDVAREAADMVLLDDNFATIVAAVEEGRTLYDNVRRFIRYLLTSNSAELWVMLLALLMGLPIPLLPLQILWINLITDGLPALSLSLEPPERDVMRRPPHHPQESVFSRGLGWHVLLVGLTMAGITLGQGYWLWATGVAEWRTALFTTLALAQMWHVLAIRSEQESLLTRGLFTNPALLGAVALTVILQIAAVYWSPLQKVLRTEALGPELLLGSLLLSHLVFWVVEGEKWVRRRMALRDK